MNISTRPAHAMRAPRPAHSGPRRLLAALIVAILTGTAALVTLPAYAAGTTTATQIGTVSGFSGTTPAYIAVTPDGRTAYVTHFTGHTISVIDTATTTQTGTVSGLAALGGPYGAIVSRDGKTLYVADSLGNGSIVVVDTATNAQTGTVSGYTGKSPRQFALSPDGKTLYVTNYNDSSISVINTATNTQTATIPSSTVAPDSIALSPDGRTLYAGSAQEPGLQIIDTTTRKPIGSVAGLAGTTTTALALSPDGTLLYVAGGTALSVVDTTTRTKTAAVSGISLNAYGMAFATDGHTLFAGLQGASSAVAIVDTATNSSSVVAGYTGKGPMGIAALPDGLTLLAANNTTNNVSVIRLAKPSLSPATQTVIATAGAAITPTTALTPDGFSGAVTYTVSPALPAGLSLNPATGVIDGTAANAQAATSYTVTGSSGSVSATATVSISVAAALTPAAQTASGVVGTPLDATTALTGTGFKGPVSYSLSPSALPSGLTFSAATGVISGTPATVISPLQYTVTGSDGTSSAQAKITLRVDPYLTPATQSRVGSIGAALTPTTPLVATGFPSTPTYTVSPPLPGGLSLDSATGVVSGSPTAAVAARDYTITASNGFFSATSTVTIAVAGLAPATQTVAAVHGTEITPTQTLSPSGLTGTVVYAVSPALPAGLALDAATGVVSGTPSGDAQSATDYTISATGSAGGSATATVTISIGGAVLPGSQTIEATAGTAIDPSDEVSVHGFTGPVTFAVAPALPDGLSLNAATGVITGTPTTAQGPHDYTLTATSTGGLTAATTVKISVSAAVAPASQTLQATAGKAFSSAELTVSGLGGNVSYDVTPALPDGLSLNAETGVISGTPATGQTQRSYAITATGPGGGQVTAFVSLRIASLTPVTQSVSAVWGQPITPTEAFTPTGFTGTVTYAVSPALPDGLSLDGETGVITGTTRAPAQQATDYTVTATGQSGEASASVSIEITPVLEIGWTSLQGSAGTAIMPSNAPIASGFPGSVTYTASPALPDGLSLDAETGVITGTPRAAQNAASYTLSAAAGGFTVSKTVSITVAGLAPESQPLLAEHGAAIAPTEALTATGFTGAVTYTVSPALPDGLSLNAETGVISGTPTGDAVEKTSYTITATGSGDGKATATVKLTVLAVAPAAPTDVTVVPGAKQAYVSWAPSVDDGGAGPVTYIVTAVSSGQTCTTTATSCILTDIPPGPETFHVLASTSAGSSTPSSATAEVASSVAPETVPEAATAGASVTFRDAAGQEVTSVVPGQTVTVEATGFAPGSLIDAYLYSTPTMLGTSTIDSYGSAAFSVTIPASLPNGSHILVAAGFTPDGAVAFAISDVSVAALPGPTGAAASLADQLRIWSIKLSSHTARWCGWRTGCSRRPGTRLSFTLNQTAEVRLALVVKKKGHWRQVATSTVHGRQGLNSLRLAGRWHGKLVPARTVGLRVQTTSGGRWVTHRTLRLKVVHRHHRG